MADGLEAALAGFDQAQREGAFLIDDAWTETAKRYFANRLKEGERCNRCEEDQTHRCTDHGMPPPCQQHGCRNPSRTCIDGYVFSKPAGDCQSCGHQYQQHNFRAEFIN